MSLALLEPYAPFLFMGLAGSAHCAGMCGAFAACAAHRPGRASLRAWSLYGAGKTATYVVLALTASVGWAQLGGDLEHGSFELLRRGLSVLAGILIIATGASMTGLLPRRPGSTPGMWTRPASLVHALLDGVRALLDSVRALPIWPRALGTGLVTGLLPCGLTLSMLTLATTMRPQDAVVGATAFGIATLPALGGVALGRGWLSPPWRVRIARFAGPALILLGLVTMSRGLGANGSPMCTQCNMATQGDDLQQIDA